MVNAAGGAGLVQLAERYIDHIHMLRLRRPSRRLLKSVGSALGIPLPEHPNRAKGVKPRAIWMGPYEWMIVGPDTGVDVLTATLEGEVALAVDVGHGRYALDVSGPCARDFLAKAISLDLEAGRFPVDSTAMTLFAQVPVVVDRCEPSVFRLWFDISYQHYVRLWCNDALVEFGTRSDR